MTDERDPADEAAETSAGNFWDRLQSLPEDSEHATSVHEDEAYWHQAPPESDASLVRPPTSVPTPVEPTRIAPASVRPAPPPATETPQAPVVPAPVPPTAPPAEAPPAAVPPTPAPLRRRRRSGFLTKAFLLVLVLTVGAIGWGWYRFAAIERVDTQGALASGGAGTNYLIVGSDSREGLAEDDLAAAGAEGLGGQRADTMLILRVDDSGTSMLSIPRDLWVTLDPGGNQAKINAAYNDGPASVIRTINGIGIPIHRYMEVDFASFQGLVGAVGGVTIAVPNPARDPNSGLLIEETGEVRLSGEQALAYVRSRHYEELIDGTWREDPRADLGRIERQKTFMAAVLGELTSTWNPIELDRAARAAGGGLRLDDEMTLLDALRMGWDLRGADYEIVELPVENFRAPDGSSALRLLDGAGEVIAQFSR
jgi:LCP family protein required for cell wall assembly